MGSKERREREKQATRQRILDAARQLFVEHGYDQVTMREIARRIEYSPTAIYLHFADKEALMTELSVCDFRAFTDAFERLPANADPLGRLQDLARAMVGFAVENPHQYRLLFMTPRPAPPPEAMVLKPDVDAYDLLVRAVQQARDAGLVHPGWAVDLTAQVLWGSLHGLVALKLVLPAKDRVPLLALEQLTTTATCTLMVGFAQPPGLLPCG
ncbi:MAG: TetR/AcrR family transcriptional regulator [Myxococcota bacterium]